MPTLEELNLRLTTEPLLSRLRTEPLSIDVLAQVLRDHPEVERTWDFECCVICLAASAYYQDSVTAESLTALLEGEGDPLKKFIAFFVLHTKYRRRKDYRKVLELYDAYARYPSGKYGDAWKDYAYLKHIALERYTLPGSEDELNLYIVKEAEERLSDPVLGKNPGVLHLFALLTARFFGADTSHGDLRQPYLDRALRSCREAIRLSNAPRFYNTEGRLLSLLGDYDGASASIRRAISEEWSDGADYAIRIASYSSHKVKIEAMQQMELLKAQQSELDEKLKRIQTERVKTLELMGLFVAVVSFIIGSIQITLSVGGVLSGAAGLILVLMGAVVLAFCGVSFVLRNFEPAENSRGYLSALLLGLALILGGLLASEGRPLLSIPVIVVLFLGALLLYAFGEPLLGWFRRKAAQRKQKNREVSQ